MFKMALKSRVAGQDGIFLEKLLLKENCGAHGIERCALLFSPCCINYLCQKSYVDIRCFLIRYGETPYSINVAGVVPQVKSHRFNKIAAQIHYSVLSALPFRSSCYYI